MRPIILLSALACLFIYCSGCKKAATTNKKAGTDTANTALPATSKPTEIETYPYVDTFIGGLRAILNYDGGPFYLDTDAGYKFYVRHMSRDTITFFSSRVIFDGLEYPRELSGTFIVDTSNNYSPVFGGETYRIVADSLYVKWSDFYHHKGGQSTGGFVDANGVYAGKRIDHSPR